MQVMRHVLLLLIGWMVMAGVAWSDGVLSQVPKLPRSFEGVRLRMAEKEIATTVHHAGRIDRKSARHHIMTVQLKDRHLRHIEYRFHHGMLREIAISYNPHRVPGGYKSLVARLKEIYGQPAVEDREEYDPQPDVFSVTKTIWRDDVTTIVLTRSQRLDEERKEIVLTITDRALQQAYEDERRREYRQRVFSVPVPLGDTMISLSRDRRTGSELSRNYE